MAHLALRCTDLTASEPHVDTYTFHALLPLGVPDRGWVLVYTPDGATQPDLCDLDGWPMPYREIDPAASIVPSSVLARALAAFKPSDWDVVVEVVA